MRSGNGMHAVMSGVMVEEDGCPSKMKVLSIDVGMKNLAYCLFECDIATDATDAKDATGEIKTPESIMQLVHIVAWDTVNLCDDGMSSEKPVGPVCSHDGCKFAAKFMLQPSPLDAAPSHYCTRHANASEYKMPLPPPLGSAKLLKKLPLEELKDFSCEYLSVPIPEKCEKSKLKLLQHIQVALSCEYLVPVSTKPKVISAAAMDLITIGRNMRRQFDALPHIASGIDVVIIENQLSTLATRMKTLQGMITQYFIMRGVPDIRFISATNKLKLFSKEGEDKTDYADRKKRSIEITRSLINATTAIAMRFEKHKKKDDLADCFLQGVWWLCK